MPHKKAASAWVSLLALALLLTLVSCGQDIQSPTEVAEPEETTDPVSTIDTDVRNALLSELLNPGVIHFGADFGAPPNQFINEDGERDGLNPAICNEIANRLGLEAQWTNLGFPGLIPALQAERLDALCTSVFITDERQEIMNMIPYVQWGEAVLVEAGNPEGITCDYTPGVNDTYEGCYEAMQGLEIAVGAGGTQERSFRTWNEKFAERGEPQIILRAFDSSAEVFQALVAGQVVGGAVNDPQGAFFMSRHPDRFEFAFEAYSLIPLALTTLESKDGLATGIHAALEEMRADGAYQAILNEWALSEVESFEFER